MAHLPSHAVGTAGRQLPRQDILLSRLHSIHHQSRIQFPFKAWTVGKPIGPAMTWRYANMTRPNCAGGNKCESCRLPSEILGSSTAAEKLSLWISMIELHGYQSSAKKNAIFSRCFSHRCAQQPNRAATDCFKRPVKLPLGVLLTFVVVSSVRSQFIPPRWAMKNSHIPPHYTGWFIGFPSWLMIIPHFHHYKPLCYLEDHPASYAVRLVTESRKWFALLM